MEHHREGDRREGRLEPRKLLQPRARMAEHNKSSALEESFVHTAIKCAASQVAIVVAACSAPMMQPGGVPEARNMELFGYHDLQARSAYQPLVREQNGRWIAYIGHHGGTD
jgi:hypothetical protein